MGGGEKETGRQALPVNGETVARPGKRNEQTSARLNPSGRTHSPDASQTPKTPMPMQSEKATFVSALQQCMSLEAGSALLAADVDTFEKLRAKRGLNVDTPEDGSILALLNKMKGYESKVDLDIDGVDADALRRLHIKMRKDSHAPPADSGGGMLGQPMTQAAEDAASASMAKEKYDTLFLTQGVPVSLNEQLDYTLMHSMSSLLTKNGTINKRIGLKNMVKQSEKKKTHHKLGVGLSVNFEEDPEDDGSVRYNDVTLTLWTFFRGLAAVLTEEVPSNPDGVGKTLVTDPTSGEHVFVSGTYNACMTLMFAIIKNIGKYPLRCADGIFRNAFNKVMDLTVTLHFDDAVTRTINYHPQAFLPMDEDLEDTSRAKKGGGGGPATGAQKRGAPSGGGQTPKKKKIDASANPCHGQVYSGACTKKECPFDHHTERCAAFKAAHPDGPPGRR